MYRNDTKLIMYLVATILIAAALPDFAFANPLESLGTKATEGTGFVLQVFGAVGGLIAVVGGILVKAGLIPQQWFTKIIVIAIIVPILPAVINWWTEGAVSGLLGG